MPDHKLAYVICYDIPDNRRRVQLAQYLAGLGGRVQYSVFEAYLDQRLLERLTARIEAIIDPKQDRVSVYRLCADCAQRSMYWGLAQLEERPGREIVFIV